MKTSEMIAMLEKNPKLVFSQISGNREIFVGVHKTGHFIQWCKYNGEIRKEDLPARLRFFGNVHTNGEWQLVREPVPAWEAIKAYMEGKVICCEMTPSTNAFHLSLEKTNSAWNRFDMEWLQHGTWYIKDSPNA